MADRPDRADREVRTMEDRQSARGMAVGMPEAGASLQLVERSAVADTKLTEAPAMPQTRRPRASQSRRERSAMPVRERAAVQRALQTAMPIPRMVARSS